MKLTTRLPGIVPYKSPKGRLYVKDVDKLKYHKYDVPGADDMHVPDPKHGSDMEKYNEMTSLLKSKKMTLGRNATKDQMKEMRALERKQRMNKAKKVCGTKKKSVVKRK